MWIHFCLIVLFVAVGILTLLYSIKEFQNWLKSPHASSSYKRQPALFSHAERSFLGVLEYALGSDYKVFGKVRIADLIKPENGVGRQIAFNRIARKHVDFVVCNATDLSVIGVIELDDKSNNPDDRQKWDAFVDKAFASAGIPVTRFPARATYSLPASEESIQRSFKLIDNKKVKAPHLKLVVPARSGSLCDFSNERF
ncbi:MAG: DUF2726 domain-containing protein [Syntrophobacteraceae bacterium]|jgi:hypothetical protein